MAALMFLIGVQLSVLVSQHVSQHAILGPLGQAGSASTPGTVPVAPGQPLPERTWIERQMPGGAIRSYMQTGGKHGRAFYHSALQAMVFAGGDWHTTQPQYEGGEGVGSEIWALDVGKDRWTLL